MNRSCQPINSDPLADSSIDTRIDILYKHFHSHYKQGMGQETIESLKLKLQYIQQRIDDTKIFIHPPPQTEEKQKERIMKWSSYTKNDFKKKRVSQDSIRFSVQKSKLENGNKEKILFALSEMGFECYSHNFMYSVVFTVFPKKTKVHFQ